MNGPDRYLMRIVFLFGKRGKYETEAGAALSIWMIGKDRKEKLWNSGKVKPYR